MKVGYLALINILISYLQPVEVSAFGYTSLSFIVLGGKILLLFCLVRKNYKILCTIYLLKKTMLFTLQCNYVVFQLYLTICCTFKKIVKPA